MEGKYQGRKCELFNKKNWMMTKKEERSESIHFKQQYQHQEKKQKKMVPGKGKKKVCFKVK